MNMDFSQMNLQYLIQARDLTQQDPQLAAVLLGLSDEMACLLPDVTPHQIGQIIQIQSPLLIPRQEAWWWSRLLMALRDGRPDEIADVLEDAGLTLAL